MEEEIKSVYKDVVVDFTIGTGGNFIVEVDGEIIFSKRALEQPRFPNPGEILELIEKNGKKPVNKFSKIFRLFSTDIFRWKI